MSAFVNVNDDSLNSYDYYIRSKYFGSHVDEANNELSDSFVGPHTKEYFEHINPVVSSSNVSIPNLFEGSSYDQIMNRLYSMASDQQSKFQILSAYGAMLKDSEEARLNREFQQTSADKSMEFSADQAKLNREYLTEMSNSSYQRAVADMKKAGLNPILLATKGFSGASVPSTSAPGGDSAGGSSARGYFTSGSTAEVQTAGQIREQETKVFSSAMSLIGTLALAFLAKGKIK